MIEIAKQMEANQYGETLVYYRLYNTAKAAIFFFENREKDKSFQCLMDMEMENLYIEGEPEGATNFSIKLSPGQTCHKMLLPVEEGVATGIKMRYDFKLDKLR